MRQKVMATSSSVTITGALASDPTTGVVELTLTDAANSKFRRTWQICV